MACALGVAYQPLGRVWAMMVRFPYLVNEDLHSGLPYTHGWWSWFFHDIGRPSYVYNLLLWIVNWIPGYTVYELRILFLVFGFLYIYMVTRALAMVASPVLLLPLSVYNGQGMVHFEIMGTLRSYATEFVSLGSYLICACIVATRGSGWAVGAAFAFLSLACMDNPFHLVGLVGFLIGFIVWCGETNRASGKEYWFSTDQKVAVVFGVLSCVAVLGPVFGAVGADKEIVDISFSGWIENLIRDEVLLLYLLPTFLLALRPPSRWYPLACSGALTGLVVVFLPLLLEHRTMENPWRYTRATLAIIIVTNLGLLFELSVRVRDRWIGEKSRQTVQLFMQVVVVAGSLILFHRDFYYSKYKYDESYWNFVLRVESGISLYNASLRAGPDSVPIYLQDEYLMTEWSSLAGSARPKGLGLDREQFGLKKPWVAEAAPCDEMTSFLYVGLPERIEGAGSRGPCARCVVEESFKENSDVSEDGFSFRIGGSSFRIQTWYLADHYPYVLWRCPAVAGGSLPTIDTGS